VVNKFYLARDMFCTITAYYIQIYAKISTVNLYQYKFTVLMRAYVGI